jgi:hypothetical protein
MKIELKKEKTITTPQLSIAGNVMTWGESVIQLSNISSISTVPLDLMPFPTWAILILCGGLFLFKYTWAISLILMACAAAYIYFWYLKNSELKSQKNLIILTNSGMTFTFLFQDQNFLDQVFKVLTTIMAEKDTGTHIIKVNINESTISGNAKILNDLFVS